MTDSYGNTVGEIDADVTSSEEPADCRTEGKITYTAKVALVGLSYTDTRYDVLPALGHAFDAGTEVALEDGQTAMEFECTRCHEHFVIRNSATEE